ncbi:serine/threonine-protein kinase PCRK1-like isoform X2 [Neltuma alba]|uniref:serine/threonine-protein kinase PCRK1-like isoform X2 n=1 Tax=Neltuma alba TaxID=207710 RepID=UPI0010A3F7A7|nr:serine/threonine-protein kinase PCRK1-like isoform X2 [Prosopis alba]XP_028807505.1 serine/threonine-protein kinase PCRK1-like isoform X2 [Prosopis alba]
MKCFHFSNAGGEPREDDDSVTSKVSKLSWARSLSVASSTLGSRRSEFDSELKDFSDAVEFHKFLSQRRANDLRVFSFSELKLATRGFSRALLIGEGGFGCVYKGVVKVPNEHANDGCLSNMDVAIKQLNRNGPQGHREWINEVNLLGVIKHPNLVKLVGYCAEDDERGIQRLLVYELMRNKSLEDHLLGRVPSALTWIARLKIAQDAARGLAYLHEEMDFQVVGTIGYAAPEYVHTGKLTAKSDVWSFGVVLFELITGRRAVERNLPRNEQKLLEWVRHFVSDPRKFHLLVDPRLEGQYCIKSVQKLAALANRCLVKHPKYRPKMSEVVEILGGIINDAVSQFECPLQAVVSEEEKEEKLSEEDTESGAAKQGNNYLKKVVDFREMMSLRNKSIRRLDWKNWAPGLVRT